jgi:hypothetical protein
MLSSDNTHSNPANSYTCSFDVVLGMWMSAAASPVQKRKASRLAGTSMRLPVRNTTSGGETCARKTPMVADVPSAHTAVMASVATVIRVLLVCFFWGIRT